MTATQGQKPDTLQYVALSARSGAPPHPGLLLLHGRGSNEQDLLSLGSYIDPRFVVISARGPFTFGPDSYYWYDLDASLAGQPSPESIEFSLSLVTQFIDQIIPAHSIDPEKMLVGGFSMGGAMAAASALMFPDRVAGAIILSGYVPIHTDLPYRADECAGHPIFQGHGTLDEVLPVDLGRMTRDYLSRTPVELTYREYPIAHEVSPQELEDVAKWTREVLDGPLK